jgi:hypothetical protein
MEQPDKPLQGFIPGNTNVEFIYITGAIVSWWARIEGIMMHDIMALRTWPFSESVVQKNKFPMNGKAVIKHWRKLIENGYRFFSLEPPDLAKMVNESLALLCHRNALSHSFWPWGQSDLQRLELNWIKKDDSGEWGVSRGTYSATLAELDSVNTRLAHLYTAVMAVSFNSHKLYQLDQATDT